MVHYDGVMFGDNPFRASLGSSPPLLVGRDEVIEDFTLALREGPGTHERVTLLVGARGVGKTVLLNELEDTAAEHGWITFSETATEGFVQNLKLQIGELLNGERATGKRTIQIGPSFLRFKQEGEGPSQVTGNLRSLLSQALDLVAENSRFNERPSGILITIDELHYVHQNEITEFATTIQHLIRENREIAVVLAGIPTSIRPLLASQDGRNPITFLRRANRIDLGRLPDSKVREGLSVPVQDAGRTWNDQALNYAVEASGGYPFMIQLIGNYSWRFADGEEISLDATQAGVAKARKKLGQLVHEPALSDLSSEDRRFLAAMSLDDGESKITEIAKRLGVSDQQAYNYRSRLNEADLVTTGRGTADFVLPFLREHLREHVVTDLLRIEPESSQ
ncbi:AAA family ATPase [Corynebacterium sp. TA-R-1]|uniref:AAA family ATPase n=1 Tax=Corynebacterium stercoris TaxID=2943490 RepID=A0ABT1G5B0_9CORY|nr:AAA family ATPase [Corynebacterium stercoris]MCP1388243.1 AAA family ATPase [Corynebacterium stercoris]